MHSIPLVLNPDSSIQFHNLCYLLSNLLSKTETENKKLATEAFASALNYRDAWNKELHRRNRMGLNLADPIPHPDDIILDANKMSFRVAAPLTKDDRPRYKIGADLLEAYQEVNLKRHGQLKTMHEGPERRKVERDLSVKNKLVDRLSQIYGPRKERTKDPFVKDVERLLGVELESEEGADQS